MQARYYDPVIGRFYSNDPVGYTAKNPVMSFNRYLYVNNNPYKYTDPDGEFIQTLVGGGAGFIAEVATQIMTDGKVTSWNKVAVSTGVGAVTGGLSLVGHGLKAGTKALAGNSAMEGIAAAGGSLISDGLDGNIEGSFDRAGQAAFDSAIGAGKQGTMAVKGILKEAGVKGIKSTTGNKIIDKSINITIETGTKGMTGAAVNMINKVDDEKIE